MLVLCLTHNWNRLSEILQNLADLPKCWNQIELYSKHTSYLQYMNPYKTFRNSPKYQKICRILILHARNTESKIYIHWIHHNLIFTLQINSNNSIYDLIRTFAVRLSLQKVTNIWMLSFLAVFGCILITRDYRCRFE